MPPKLHPKAPCRRTARLPGSAWPSREACRVPERMAVKRLRGLVNGRHVISGTGTGVSLLLQDRPAVQRKQIVAIAGGDPTLNVHTGRDRIQIQIPDHRNKQGLVSVSSQTAHEFVANDFDPVTLCRTWDCRCFGQGGSACGNSHCGFTSIASTKIPLSSRNTRYSSSSAASSVASPARGVGYVTWWCFSPQ